MHPAQKRNKELCGALHGTDQRRAGQDAPVQKSNLDFILLIPPEESIVNLQVVVSEAHIVMGVGSSRAAAEASGRKDLKSFKNINTIQYNTIQYNTIQYNTTQYNTIQYNTIQYNTVQYSTVQYSTVQYSTIHYKTRQDKTRQDETRQDKTRQDKTRQDKTRQYTTIHYNTIQYTTIQYNTMQYSTIQNNIHIFVYIVDIIIQKHLKSFQKSLSFNLSGSGSLPRTPRPPGSPPSIPEGSVHP